MKLNPTRIPCLLFFSHMKTQYELNKITRVKFQVGRVSLNKEFYQDYNRLYKDRFFSCFSQEMQQLFKITYDNQLAKIKKIPFFLDQYLKDDTKIYIPNYNSSICAIDRLQNYDTIPLQNSL